MVGDEERWRTPICMLDSGISLKVQHLKASLPLFSLAISKYFIDHVVNHSFVFCSSVSCSFKDSYGFIRGARESESELFHFVCRELKQHYSSFYRVSLLDKTLIL